MACPAPSSAAPLVSSLADYLECHASALGRNGFEDGANGFFLTVMLTGCLTIYVGLIGYRLVLGQSYSVREAVLACLRVGLVITFCTRWPSYEAVFYRTAVDGPQEIAGQMLQSSGLALMSPADLADRLQQDYNAIQMAAVGHPQPPPPSTSPQAPGVALPQAENAPQQSIAPPPAAGFTVAGLVFLTSTLGSLLAARLAAALLMAIGPLVLVLALFDSLVGFLENWVGALVGTMLATVGITIISELELGFVEGRVSEFGPTGSAQLTDQGLLLVSFVFGLCVVGVVLAAGLVGKHVKFRGLWLFRDNLEPGGALKPQVVPTPTRSSGALGAPPSRALAVANAVRVEGQRERLRLGAPPPVSPRSSDPPGAVGVQTATRSEPVLGPASGSAGLGHSLRRSITSGRSISRTRRGQRQ